MPLELMVPVRPGAYVLDARADGEQQSVRAYVHPADRISERVRRLLLLNAGDEYRLGETEYVFDLYLADDPETVFSTCGEAVACYTHECCEQTAAKMLGTWLAAVAGDESRRFQAMGSQMRGIDRLETMWRTGGFAMYPAQKEPSETWGRETYRHLLEMQPLRAVCTLSPFSSDLASDLGALTGRIDRLAARARAVYGSPSADRIASCHDAYLASTDRCDDALRYVLDHWKVLDEGDEVRGSVVSKNGAVCEREEVCYAGAVLLGDAPDGLHGARQ
ncbi:MAG: hypothetical protein WCI05_16965, partial [Myxococcales bacterium]